MSRHNAVHRSYMFYYVYALFQIYIAIQLLNDGRHEGKF